MALISVCKQTGNAIVQPASSLPMLTICGETIFRHNSRGDFEPEIISMKETVEPYKTKNTSFE